MEENDENIKAKIEKRVFTSNQFVETQIWIYSSFSAISLAFFFGLFGATDEVSSSSFTAIVIYTFSISLVLNAFIALIFSVLKDDTNLIHKINLSKNMKYIILVAWMSFITGVILTIGIFSIIAMLLVILLGISLFIIFNLIKKEIAIQEKKEFDEEMEKLKNDKSD